MYAVVRILTTGSSPGADPDIFRNLAAGLRIWSGGAYLPSRPPGYPLFEFLSVPLYLFMGPQTVVNLLAIGGIGLLLARWLRGLPNAVPAVLLFWVTPLCWVSAGSAMDYPLSALTFLLAFHASERKRWWQAGLWLGLSAALRWTGLIVLPLWLLWPRFGFRSRLPLLIAVVIYAIAWSPAWLNFPLRELLPIPAALPWGRMILTSARDLWGFMGTLFVIGGIVAWFFTRRPRSSKDSGVPRLLWPTVGVYGGFLLFTPIEAGYFLPVWALVVAGMAFTARRSILLALAVGLLLINLVDVYPYRVVGCGQYEWGLDLRGGAHFEDQRRRTDLMDAAKRLLKAPVPAGTRVAAGRLWPVIAVELVPSGIVGDTCVVKSVTYTSETISELRTPSRRSPLPDYVADDCGAVMPIDAVRPVPSGDDR